MKTINRLLFCGIASLVMLACGIPKTTLRTSQMTLPNSYAKASDSSDATRKWKDFFEDKRLQDLIDSALVNNQEINIMAQRVVRAQNEIQAKKGEYLPNLSLQTGAELEKVGQHTRNGAVEENLPIAEGKKFPDPLPHFSLALTTTWELDVWKKLRNSKKAAVYEFLSSQSGRNFFQTNLIAEIASSYYELLALDNQLRNLEQNIALQQSALEMVKLLKESARTTELAVKRFEAEVQKNQSELFRLRQEITETENNINFLVGRTPQAIVRNPVEATAVNPQWVRSGIPSDLLENRQDIQQAKFDMEAAQLNVQVAKAQFYPSLGMRAGIGWEAFNTKYLIQSPQSLMYNLAGDLLLPLVNRNAIKAAYKNASAKQVESVLEYEKTVLNAYVEVVNLLTKMDNLQQSYELKNKQVEALNQSVDTANLLFLSARADYMEVLLTQRDVLEAKTELIKTRKEQQIAAVQLYKALGGGWK